MANLANGERRVTLSKDTAALCGTKHRVKASITGTNVGDQINIKYKLESTSGLTTNYHTNDGYLHKIRITIKNGNETVYQQDFTGDDSGEYISAPPFLINKAGRWNLYAKSIAAGDCAKPEGDIYFAYFRATEPKKEEQEEMEEKPINPDDLTPLLSVGLIGLAGLAFAKILRGKRSRKAETFEAQAPKKFNYRQIIYDTFYGDGDEEIKKYQEEITEQDNPWFPTSYYPDEKEFDEKDRKRYMNGIKKFIESHYLYIQPNISRFASFTINGKDFLAFRFSEGKEYYITSKEKWLETAKHDLRTSEQPLPYAQIKGMFRLLEKGKYQDFRQAMIRNNVRFSNVLNRGVVLNLINVQMREAEKNQKEKFGAERKPLFHNVYCTICDKEFQSVNRKWETLGKARKRKIIDNWANKHFTKSHPDEYKKWFDYLYENGYDAAYFDYDLPLSSRPIYE